MNSSLLASVTRPISSRKGRTTKNVTTRENMLSVMSIVPVGRMRPLSTSAAIIASRREVASAQRLKMLSLRVRRCSGLMTNSLRNMNGSR